MGRGIPYRNIEGFPDPTAWAAINNMITEQDKLKKQFRGAQSRASGHIFEEQIRRSITWYEDKGIMAAEKTPEPMRPLRPLGRQGHFEAFYEKKAQADFSGTLIGGRAIRFEAKQTDTDRFTRDRLTDEQIKDLDKHERMGAYCCVMLCFGLQHFYRVPWIIWKEMKTAYGRLYVKEEDLKVFRLPFEGGIIKLLADTEEEVVLPGQEGR